VNEVETIIVLSPGTLVVLIGASASGKSTFASRNFRPTQVLASDRFRAMLSDDEADQSVSAQAFEILHQVARFRLRLGRLTVVDATNVTAEARLPLVEIARQATVPIVAIAFDLTLAECLENSNRRTHRRVPPEVIRAHTIAAKSSLGHLLDEGFERVYVLEGRDRVQSTRIVQS
jgi:protein phosphatase